MASILKVDDLRGNTAAGNITITSEGGSATMQLQQGVAKAWVNFNGTGTIATRDSFNVSSLNDDGTGKYDVVLTNNMGNNDYSVTIGGANNSSDGSGETAPSGRRIDLSTSQFGLRNTAFSSSTTFNDGEFMFGTVHGDLA